MPYKDPEKKKEANKRAEERRKQKNGERHKVWAGIFYPDSAPGEWRDLLSDEHLRVWVSPLHDKDKWTVADERRDPAHKAGMLKKPHYHYVVEYEIQVDLQTVLADFAFLRGPASVKAVKSLRSMVRYLAHLDDPQKAQYDRSDILTYGGAEVDIVEQLGSHERHAQLRAMKQFIWTHRITNFCDFVNYCDACEEVWSQLLDDNSSYVIEKYIKSYSYALEKGTLGNWSRVPINPITGEALTDASGAAE